jgi:hypothetical protein
MDGLAIPAKAAARWANKRRWKTMSALINNVVHVAMETSRLALVPSASGSAQ